MLPISRAPRRACDWSTREDSAACGPRQPDTLRSRTAAGIRRYFTTDGNIESGFFQTAALQLGAGFDTGTNIRTVLRFSPNATVFAIDPFAGRLAVYDPSLSVQVTQELPSFGLPIRAEAVLDARNLLDVQSALTTERYSPKSAPPAVLFAVGSPSDSKKEIRDQTGKRLPAREFRALFFRFPILCWSCLGRRTLGDSCSLQCS